MPSELLGLPLRFTLKRSWEVQPGSVPGPGGHYDHYICDYCGWVHPHRTMGYLREGEHITIAKETAEILQFHQDRCPKRGHKED